MSQPEKTPVGAIAWCDLTVDDADNVRSFYEKVVGWKTSEQSMGDYADYNVLRPGDGECVAGICHARGANAKIPPQWLIYTIVESVESSAAACRDNGGEVLDGPRPMGGKAFCVIRDPAGAVMALMEA